MQYLSVYVWFMCHYICAQKNKYLPLHPLCPLVDYRFVIDAEIKIIVGAVWVYLYILQYIPTSSFTAVSQFLYYLDLCPPEWKIFTAVVQKFPTL